MKISLCLMVWNELNGCKCDVPKLPLYAFDEVYAIDGGSTDGTVSYLESKGIPVYKQPAKGLNAAYIHAANQSNCDAIVVFFPKGTIPTDDLLRFRPLFDDGYELIIASRNIKGGHNEEDERLFRPRKWGVMFLASFAGLKWRSEGNYISDVLHGFKGFTLSAFWKIDPQKNGLSIDLEMVIKSYRFQIKRVEFPTNEKKRIYSKSKFPMISTGTKLFKYLMHELKR
jgi:glycosyltransferase involved in cell wall biosynthesis